MQKGFINVYQNMKKTILASVLSLFSLACCQTDPTQHYVEQVGNKLIWHDTQEPALFYGTNYTAPFAYAYRAIQRKGINHKAAIDQDVYHMARLGFNAFRLHIWDVEITDSVGNLIDNEHLDLLDYLIYKVEERGMYVILTLQTNFGNGYPEKDIQTNGYSYLYDKCSVHSNPQAIKAQKRYATALMQHKNRYTGRTYGTDYMTVGYEINNEPCHIGDAKTTNNYVKTMVRTLRNAGCTRLIFYNASHNFPEHTAAYFDSTNINGITFQWYPTALVHNSTRKGNFLPSVEHYNIPFDTLKNFNNVARIVYEFDPADNDYTILYPAMARSFRKAGMTWATQFAYDPTAIADCNTEYVTHYMNLAYTPGKAISQMIAAEVMRQTDITDYDKTYPTDTIFGNCTLSYHNNLAVWNSADKFYYTNTTTIKPSDTKQLQHIAGVGSSHIVEYDGNGAYFLDKLDDETWRLEIMPDVVRLRDAYHNTTEEQPVATTQWNKHKIRIKLNDINISFDSISPCICTITKDGFQDFFSFGFEPTSLPGINKPTKTLIENYTNTKINNNINVWEYVAPQPSAIQTTNNEENTNYDIEFFSLPEWCGLSYLIEGENICATFSPDKQPYNYIIRKNVKSHLSTNSYIELNITDINNIDSIYVSAISTDGIAFCKQIEAKKGIQQVAIRELKQAPTPILPRGWPAFVDQYFSTTEQLELKDIEFIDIATGYIENNVNITINYKLQQ